ncbi:MAG: FG-GAP-like repeat-containing protein, partial [Bacteroidota bacterium]
LFAYALFDPSENSYIDTTMVTLRSNRNENSTTITSVDVDGDEDLDIMVSTSHRIYWLENLDGNATFSSPNDLLGDDIYIYNTTLADMDGDGDLDLLFSSSTLDIIGWMRNLDGALGFSEPIILTTDYDQPFSAKPMDVDNDGDLDVIASSFWNDVIWLENLDGNGTFSDWQLFGIETGFATANALVIEDINLDGYQDVIKMSLNATSCFIYINSGNNGLVDYELVVLDYPVNVTGVRVAFGTIDEDEYPDIVISSSGENVVMWAKNLNGTGAFSFFELITDDLSGIAWSRVVDVDMDGDNDVVIASCTSNVYWAENEANQFGSIRLVGDDSACTWNTVADDFDGDNDVDIISLAVNDDIILYYQNLGLEPILSGFNYYDENTNGQRDSTEIGIPFNAVNIMPGGQTQFTSTSGSYGFVLENGQYNLSAGTPEHWMLASTPATFDLNIENETVLTDINFGFVPAVDLQELSINTSSGFTRCNAIIPFWINIANTGTTTVNGGELMLNLPVGVEVVSADIEPDNITDNTLEWNLPTVLPFDQRTILLQLQMPGAEQLGDTLTFLSTVSIMDDLGNLVVSDETRFDSEIRCAYDPNDKLVEPARDGVFNPTLVDEALTYTIRFQNTGTDTAFQVRIEDQLDAHLDWSTFHPLAASHPFVATINDGGLVTFLFEGIQLVDSLTNEPESHGYVKYSIMPMNNLLEGTEVLNMAYIFFDLNPPIVTNTTNTFVSSLRIEQPDNTLIAVTIFPNPTRDRFSIDFQHNERALVSGFSVRHISGQLVASQKVDQLSPITIEAESWPAGSYILELSDVNGRVVSRDMLIKI